MARKSEVLKSTVNAQPTQAGKLAAAAGLAGTALATIPAPAAVPAPAKRTAPVGTISLNVAKLNAALGRTRKGSFRAVLLQTVAAHNGKPWGVYVTATRALVAAGTLNAGANAKTAARLQAAQILTLK